MFILKSKEASKKESVPGARYYSWTNLLRALRETYLLLLLLTSHAFFLTPCVMSAVILLYVLT